MSEFICEGASVGKTDKKTDKRSIASVKCAMACGLNCFKIYKPFLALRKKNFQINY